MKVVERVRQEIAREFSFLKSEVIERSVVEPDGDPGGWAPDALAIIYHEYGLPTAIHTAEQLEAYARISDRLNLIVEPINGAVSAVYNV